jgi:hypothetical protein
MPRPILQLALSLLFGVVTTIAVSWTLAWVYIGPIAAGRDVGWVQKDDTSSVVVARRHRVGLVVQWAAAVCAERAENPTADPWADSFIRADWKGRDLREAPPGVQWGDVERPPMDFLGIAQFATGWPFPALWCEVPDAPAATPLLDPPMMVANASPGSHVTSGSILPTRPIAVYFVADSLFFGAVGFVAMSGFTGIRRARRRRRGGCVKCGYAITGVSGAVCPECGGTTLITRGTPIPVN